MNISLEASEAARAVQARLGERVPSVRYMLVNRREIADVYVSASGRQGSPKARDRYYRYGYRMARTALGLTVPTPAGIVVALRSDKLRRSPEQVWPTLVHELVHAVQFTRPGVVDEWLAGELHNLEIAPQSRRQVRADNRRQADREREAYRIEAELARGGV